MALAQTVTPNCAMPFFIDDRTLVQTEKNTDLFASKSLGKLGILAKSLPKCPHNLSFRWNLAG